ncbi:latent-transforming growth factor beta-binding protein 1-like [Dendronephthya gigantea]|uniref:latent-transforming growth factor beta-binding protein 1-like n=1 Tax=Dendronephthya gigantea TaxID=151771 RepID=UPI00106A9140|nr:latent-transforming growth factor beta-binding protein 1-like [Dendronephthya gigantea]
MAESEESQDTTNICDHVSPQKSAAGGLFDSDKLRLIMFFNNNPTLWDNKPGKDGKKEKEEATTRLVETFEYKVRPSNLYTANCQLSNSTVKMNKTKMKNGPWVFYEDVLVTEDVDECAKGTHQCSQKANCSNTPGSYNCQCQIGYEENGKKCNDIDECADSPCGQNANCTNTNGSYICECRTGYEGNGTNCTDIDECQKGTHKCNQSEICSNTPGSYNCENRNLKDSEILKNEPGDFDRKLREWLPTKKDWNVCWRASRDGWAAGTFHFRCDGKSPTLTIVKVVKDNKAFIFGGYATVSWAGPSKTL